MRIGIFEGRGPLSLLLVVCFVFSLISMVVYVAETGFSDENLFLLLTVIRYSSIIVFICSVYKILNSIYFIFIKKYTVVQGIFKIIVYFLLIVYCFGIFYLEAFISVFSGGI